MGEKMEEDTNKLEKILEDAKPLITREEKDDSIEKNYAGGNKITRIYGKVKRPYGLSSAPSYGDISPPD